MKLQISLSGYEVTRRNMQGLYGRVTAALARSIAQQTNIVHRKIVSEKLTGQVLNVVTGNLRRSIQFTVTYPAQGVVWGEIFSNGTVNYAAIHEYGGIIVPVNAKMLHWVGGDGAHHFAHRVTMPERSYMRSTLAENTDAISTAVEVAVLRAAAQTRESAS